MDLATLQSILTIGETAAAEFSCSCPAKCRGAQL